MATWRWLLLGAAAMSSGACSGAPAGMFECGDQTCSISSEYCAHTGSDVVGQPDSNTCAPLPAACGESPTCACLTAQISPCGGTCAPAEGGGLVASCPGG